ncbi:hypothetical protein R5R35_011607 [Gryllus longicercus]|uniref:Uncharacterized protein n=1 Tax=Gryllus longicercus TaxID=2509291 RepID=A0AAN9V261_9ORTH
MEIAPPPPLLPPPRSAGDGRSLRRRAANARSQICCAARALTLSFARVPPAREELAPGTAAKCLWTRGAQCRHPRPGVSSAESDWSGVSQERDLMEILNLNFFRFSVYCMMKQLRRTHRRFDFGDKISAAGQG